MKKALFNLLNRKKIVTIFFAFLLFHSFAFSQTRFYLNQNVTPPVSPAYNAAWTNTSNATRHIMSAVKETGSLNTDVLPSVSGTGRCLLDQWVSEPLAAQIIAIGTFTGQARFALNNTTPSTKQAIIYVRVINADGSIASEVGNNANANALPNGTPTNRSFTLATPLVNITAGQRLAVELGWSYVGAVNNTCTISMGSTAATADLPVNNTTQTAQNPWFNFSQTLAFLPPANTTCVNAVSLTPGYTCAPVTGNLQFASSAAPAGSCGGATATTTYSAWYSFVATNTTHSVYVSNLGAGLTTATTYTQVYSGSCLTPISLGCQATSAGRQIIGGLTIGATYFVRVYAVTQGTSSPSSNWNFDICIERPPANDDCTGAVSLTSGASCVNTAGTLDLSTVNGTTPIGCFAAGTYYDVWYSFIATTFTHTVTLSSAGANITSPQLQIYSGACGALVSMGCASGLTITQANLTPGNTYYVRVANLTTNPSGLGTVADFNICVISNPPPTNDACAGSVLLASNIACSNTTGNLQYASSAAPAGTCGGATATTTYDIWYRFVANSTTHAITLSSLGSNLAAATTYIETFSGACGSLASLDCQNASSVAVVGGLTVGNTYYVRIYVTTAPNNATTANWNFNICIQQPPANDECTGAVSLTPGASCVNTAGTLHVATPNVATPLGCFAAGTYYDVWYSFTATTFTHTVTLSSLGANITAPGIQIYSGTCGALVSVGCVSGTTLTQANLTPGTTYYVRVANYNADPSGAAGFNICVVSNPPPANDACTGSVLLTSNFVCSNTTGNMQYASSAAPAGTCGGATATTTYGVWYRFVANSTTHYITLSSLGSNLAAATTYIETFSGACGSLTSIGCQAAATIETLSGLTIGSTYYIRIYVTTAPNNATTANWNFNICIQQPPANDECTGAVSLTPGASCVNTAGTINLATENASTALGCFVAGAYYDVWYSFTAVTTIQTITLSSTGANFTAPRIQLYSGPCGSLTSIACASGTSLLQYGLTVGATYYVRIANYNVNPLTAANFNICITYITPPANDECTGATTVTSGTGCTTFSGTLFNASPNSTGITGCGNSGSAEVWFKFIANSNRPTINLSSLGANLTAGTTYMQLFSGLCGSLTSLACTVSPLNTAITPGGVGLTINSTYYIRVITSNNTGVPVTGSTATWGFNICVTDPVGAAVDFAKTYVNITDGTAGGTIDPGDVLEIRSILVVQRPGSSGANVAIDSVAFYDTLTANKGFRLLRDSMALKTNEGKLFRPTNSTYFTDNSADADAAWITTGGAGTDTALQINMGTGATRTARGKIGHTSRPSNFGSTCIIQATYRVRVTAAYGTTIKYGGGAFRYRDSTTGVFYTVNFPKDSLIVFASPGACPDAASATNVVGDEFGGTFGAPTGSPVFPQNRGTSANTNYAYATFGGGNGPGDYYYGVANNTSGDGSTVQTLLKPTATSRVFTVWDISGDHTGATNTGSTSKGNLPCNLSAPISATNPCGYMLVVNSAYRADVAFEYNFSGACTETYYEISAWMKNVCSKCGCDSTGTGSTIAGYQPTAPGDSSGVRPNVAFQINGIDYYTTGDIVHQGVGAGIPSTRSDTLNRWIKRSFVYKTKPGETSFNMTFRNNAPGGGGNDWAIDDISIRTCYPNMSYSPSYVPNTCANNTVAITDTVRSYYNTYTSYKWQRSTNGGSTWVDIAGTTGTATPAFVGGMYQFVTTYTVPAAFTTLANNGDQYRVVVATNATNLASIDCNFSGALPITIAITQPSVAPTAITGADICNPGSTTLTAVGGTLGTSANYQWGTGSVVGTSPIAGATNSTLTVSPTTTTTYWVRIENTSSPCTAITGGLTRTITVSQPSAAPTGITGANICSGSSTTLIATGGTLGTGSNYQWGTGSTPGANPIGGATSSTYIASPTVTTTYWVKIRNTTAPCADSTPGVTRTIIVNPVPDVIQPSNQALCPGSSTSAVNFSGAVAGTIYSWSNTTTSIGLGASGSGNIPSFTAINSGTTAITATITVTPSYTNAGATCTGTPQNFTIIVNPTPTVVAPSNQTLCSASSSSLVSFSGAVAGTTYSWSNSNTAIGLGASGSGNIPSFTATNAGTTAITATITVTPSYTNAGATCTGTPQNFTITINPTPTVVAPSNQTLCSGSSSSAVSFSGAVTGTTYSWSNSNTAIGLGASGSGNIPSFTATNAGTTPITATITVTPSYTNAGATCSDTPKNFTITVNPTPTVVAPSNQTLCSGAPSSLVSFSGAVTGTTYSWSNSNTAIGLGASGSGNIPSFTATNAGTTAITATITVTPSYTNAGATCSGTPQNFTITVNPAPTVTAPSNQALCPGSSTSAVNFSGAVVGTTYTWTNSNTAIGLGASGSGNIPSFTVTNAGTTAITATITVTPSYTNAGATCSGTPQNFTITINPTPTVVAPSNQTLCSGSSSSLVSFSGAVAGTTYSWSNSNTAIGLGASGSGNIPSFTATNAGTTAITATITVTPSYTNAGATCSGTSQNFTITVNPTPTVVAPSNQTLCSGAPSSLVSFSGAVAGTIYSWSNTATSIGLGASGSGNIPSFTAINAGTTAITATITVTPSYTNAGATCSGTPQNFTITVNPTPTVVAPSNQTLCSGAPSSLVSFSGAVTGTTYSWSNNNTAIGLGASGSGNIPSFTATNAGTTAITATITVTPSYTNAGATCTGTPQNFIITVNPRPTVTAPSNQALCPGSSTSAVNFSGAVAGTIYSWSNNNTSIGLGASGSGNIPSFTAINSGTTPITATITVTPSYTNAGATCTGTPQTFTITVRPTPDVTQPADLSLCRGTVSAAISFSSAVAGTTYTWTNSNTAIGLAASGSGNIPSFTATNTGSTPISGTITVTPTAAGCPGPSRTFTITVNLASTAPTSATGLDICNGASTTLTANGAVLGTGANYQWGTGAVVGTNPIVGATSSTLTVSPTVTTTYWVRIENGTAPCIVNTGGVTKLITVSQPSVAATAAGKNKNNICPGISAKIFRTGGTLGAGASWKWYTGSPGGTLIGSGDTLTVTPVVTTTYYLRAEGLCNTTAAQSVTIFISCDIDKDKDGIPDYIESNIAAATANGYNTGYAGYVDYNNDFINDNFQADGDSDNDGNPNYLDTDFPGRVDSNSDGIDDRFDADLDGIINMLDLDSDNDGIPDVVEANGVDANGDGKIDNFTDTDGDGLSQNVDANNTGANNSSVGLGVIDLDGDGVPNFLDLDSDNDGIPDVIEVGGADTNNNGKIDGFVDANNDGLHDSYINATGLLITGADTNGDGKADSYPNKNMDRDFRPNAYDVDSDGDGIVDVIEAGLPDVNFDGRVDGTIGTNGWSTSVSALASLGLRNTDADGKPDYLDIDADDDGIPDNIEGQTTSGYKLPTLTDADGDGLMLPYDNLPAAFAGSGILVYDHDGDGTPDYRDSDSDADGLIDRVEGNDFNLNGNPDDNVTLTGLDTDGDGLDNRFDSLNSVTNIKGTSYRMGASGSFTGDATPGSRTTVQKTIGSQPDRDWRYAGYVLPVQFLNLTGVLQADKVMLNWAVIADKAVDHFEVERSIDNNNYVKTGIVSGTAILNTQLSFAFRDNIDAVTQEVIYYRIKVVGKGGEIQFSNIIIVRKPRHKAPLTISPNPASNYATATFTANAACIATIRLVDNNGKLVMLHEHKVIKGINSIPITGLDKYSSGFYVVQIYFNNEVISQKLLIMK